MTKPKQNKLRLEWDKELADACVESFDAIVDYALEQVEAAKTEPETSVHAFRKSIRRARSHLRLLHDGRRDIDRTEINDALRAAFEPTSQLRDADVLRPIIEGVRHLATEEVVEAVLGTLSDFRETVGSANAHDILSDQIDGLHWCKWAIRKVVPEELSLKDLRHAFARSFRRCQDRRNTVIVTTTDLSVHGWRKRTKELRYQSELLSGGLGAEPVTSINAQLADLAQGLGEVTDLQILADYLEVLKVEGVEGIPELWESVRKERLRALGACVLTSQELFSKNHQDFAKAVFEGIQDALDAREKPPSPE